LEPGKEIQAAGKVMPKVGSYAELRSAIRQALIESRARLEQLADEEKVREAWEIGKLIDEHVLKHRERADYGQFVLKRLAADLKMSDTELYRMRQFARAYPISAPAQKLSWSHYQEILSLDDEKERKIITAKAESENWSRKQVREEVQKRKNPTVAKPLEKLEAKPGKAGTYKIIQAEAGPFQGELVIDLGFSNYYKLGTMTKFKAGDLVHAAPVQAQPGLDASYRFIKSGKISADDLFTYEAYVTEITDGDTFDAVIDLGFGITTQQKLRLRGLDAPEIITTGGREAKEFLEKHLKKDAPILIRTVKSDKYDRYLADVFYQTSGEEHYLNNELLKRRLAQRVYA
jgi:endonuclease YncB( thermonuclease family)